MARYTVSNKNRFGFPTYFYTTFLYAALVFIALLVLGGILFSSDAGPVLGVFGGAITGVLHRSRGVRRGRFAPILFALRDPMLPRNDLECWCASTFAIWANSFSGLEGWPLIGGSHKNKNALINTHQALEEQWEIYTREQGLETIHELIATRDQNAGWDLCRATQLLGMMYKIDLLNRDELDAEFYAAATAIQRQFHSWEELCESYLAGFACWQGFDEAGQRNTARRRAIHEYLKKSRNGPYTVPWDIDLSWPPDSSERDQTKATRKILSHYDVSF